MRICKRCSICNKLVEFKNYKYSVKYDRLYKFCNDCLIEVENLNCSHNKRKYHCVKCTDNIYKTRAYVMVNSSKAADRRYDRINREQLPDNYITIEWVENKIKNINECIYCGQATQLKHYDKNLLTIERIDNDEPHTINNCTFCCHHCNMTLHTMELIEKKIILS